MLTGQELAQLAFKAVDATSPLDFARKIGLYGDSRDRRASRWLSGENEPDFEGTMRMLAAAGLLNEAGVPRSSPVVSLGPEELEAKVDGGFDQVTTLLERIEARLSALEARRGGSASKRRAG